jgi:hypothetical protein
MLHIGVKTVKWRAKSFYGGINGKRDITEFSELKVNGLGQLGMIPAACNIPPTKPSARQDALYPERGPSEAARCANTEDHQASSRLCSGNTEPAGVSFQPF